MPDKRLMLTGTIVNTPIVKEVLSGVTIGKFQIRTTKTYIQNGKQKEKTVLYDIVLWDDLAERGKIELKKGSLLMLVGHQRKDSKEILCTTFKIIPIIINKKTALLTLNLN